MPWIHSAILHAMFGTLTTAAHWYVVIITTLVVFLCVLVHYELLTLTTVWIKRFSRRRPRMLVIIVVILLAHIAEIWLFGIGYFILVEQLHAGTLIGIEVSGLPDYVYYSAVVFTTLGFGDITPAGPVRFMTGTESLSGLVLITWSASFAFLEMQRNWR